MDLEAILERLGRVVAPEELARIGEELNAARLAGERHWLEDVLVAAETLPLVEVPPVLSRELRSLVGNVPAVQEHGAQLVSDSRTDRVLAGVRGADGLDGFTVTYASEVADLVVDAWPHATGTLTIEGQMMPLDGPPRAVRARAAGPTDIVITGDELGRFRFEELVAGVYTLSVDDGRIRLTARLDLSEAS